LIHTLSRRINLILFTGFDTISYDFLIIW